VTYERERTFARRAIAEGAEIARAHFGRVTTTIKATDHTQVVTEADLAVGRHLVETIRAAYPRHNVLDEEAGAIDLGSDWTWIVDPIDGTSNFAAGIPLYGILIGLLHEETPVVGAMALPASRDVYTCARGEGADKNGARLPTVDDATPLERRLICYGVDGDRGAPDVTRAEGRLLGDLALACLNLRSTGSAFDSAMTVEGRCGAVMYRVARIWDVVAPEVIAREVGCRVTRLGGTSTDYAGALRNPGARDSICVAPPRVHAELQEIIARYPVD
jgi:myo-inositol-1(or 4)-monophosphatase